MRGIAWRSLLRFGRLVDFHSRPGLIRGMAKVFQVTLSAFWFAGDADSTSVVNDLVGKINPLLAWEHLHEVLLDSLRIILAGQLQPARNTLHVSIHDDAYSLVKPRDRKTSC